MTNALLGDATDMHPDRYCVAWSMESNLLCMLTDEGLVNINLGAFLEQRSGLVVIRMHCTKADAERFIRAYAGVMVQRSQERMNDSNNQQAK